MTRARPGSPDAAAPRSPCTASCRPCSTRRASGAAPRSSSRTGRRASRPATRTPRCCGSPRTWCSTACSSPPRRSARTSAILYTHVDRRNDVGRRLRQAIAERVAVGADRVAVQLAEAPPRFLSGQETALVSHLSGGPAIPTFMPPRITERGLLGAPTLVQNVETLAHVALIARHGPRWFRAGRHRGRAGLDARAPSAARTERRASSRSPSACR